MQRGLWQAQLALLGATLIHGANYSLAKLIMPSYLGASAFILLRVGFAALVFYLLSQLLARRELLTRKEHLRFLFCGLFGASTNMLLFFEGLSITSPIHASLLMLASPLLVTLLGFFLSKERGSPRQYGGIVLGLAAAAMLVLQGSSSSSSASGDMLWGDILVFLNALSYACYFLLVKPLLLRYSVYTVLRWTFFYGLFFVYPFAWQDTQAIEWALWPLWAYLVLAYSLFFVTVCSYLLNAYALQSLSPSAVTSYIYLQPVFAALLASLLGQDQLSFSSLCSAVLIAFAVYLSNETPKKGDEPPVFPIPKARLG